MAIPLFDPNTQAPWRVAPAGSSQSQFLGANMNPGTTFAYDNWNPADAKYRNDWDASGALPQYGIKAIVKGSTTTAEDLARWGLAPSAAAAAAQGVRSEPNAPAHVGAAAPSLMDAVAGILQDLANVQAAGPVTGPEHPYSAQSLGALSEPETPELLDAIWRMLENRNRRRRARAL